jgi:nucleoid DNA-binding protein
MAGQKLTKSQFVAEIAERTGITKKQAGAVLDAMSEVITAQLGKKGPGEITIPGLLKLNVVDKPAVPERQGINPFTKEPTVFKAKPASRTVKARPVKALKDAV